MITKLKTKQTENNIVGKYDFKKSRLIAGICPDCKHIVMYREQFDLFECSNKDCFFIANKHGVVICNNQMKTKAEKENRIQKDINLTTNNSLSI